MRLEKRAEGRIMQYGFYSMVGLCCVALADWVVSPGPGKKPHKSVSCHPGGGESVWTWKGTI